MRVMRFEVDPSTAGSYVCGEGALDCLAEELLAALGGKPKRVACICDSELDQAVTLRCARDLISNGFKVTDYALPSETQASDVAHHLQLLPALVNDRIGPQDVIIGIGGAQTLSLAGTLASTYMGGTNLCLIPTTFDAALVSPFTSYCLHLNDGCEAMRCYTPASCVVSDTSLFTGSSGKLLLAAARLFQLGMSGALDEADYAGIARSLDTNGPEHFGEILLELIPLVSNTASFALSQNKGGTSQAMLAWSWLRLGMPLYDALRKLDVRGTRCYRDVDQGSLHAFMLADGLRFDAHVAYRCGFVDEAFCFDLDSSLCEVGLAPHRIQADKSAIVEQMTSCDERSARGLRMNLPAGPGISKSLRVHPNDLATHFDSYLDHIEELL